MLGGLERPLFAIVSAASDREDDALATCQAFGPVRTALQGRAGNDDPVEPRFQLGRKREVVHWYADHDHIRVDELLQNNVALVTLSLLRLVEH